LWLKVEAPDFLPKADFVRARAAVEAAAERKLRRFIMKGSMRNGK
jgi:hypothetical protein